MLEDVDDVDDDDELDEEDRESVRKKPETLKVTPTEEKTLRRVSLPHAGHVVRAASEND